MFLDRAHLPRKGDLFTLSGYGLTATLKAIALLWMRASHYLRLTMTTAIGYDTARRCTLSSRKVKLSTPAYHYHRTMPVWLLLFDVRLKAKSKQCHAASSPTTMSQYPLCRCCPRVFMYCTTVCSLCSSTFSTCFMYTSATLYMCPLNHP